MNNTTNSLSTAAFLMLVTRLAVNMLGVISSLVLVRLLNPADFGIAAIAMSVYAFIGLFGEFGFQTALIQKNTPEKSDYDSAFTANLLFGVTACTIIFQCANYLADFFDNKDLETVFQVLAILFLINGCKNIKAVDFQINMDFKQEMKLQVIPKFISFMFTLSLAFYLKSYWALIFGSLFASALNVFFSYTMIPYVPTLSLKSCKNLFNYSKWLMLNNLFYYLNTKSIDIFVGKYFSTSAAGLYSISKEMATLPSTEIAAPINKASLPAYSKQKKDYVALRHLFYQTTSMIGVIAIPASMGLYSTADYFVPVVLGDKWLEAIPIIQILSIFAFISSISSNNGYIFLAIGKPKLTTFLSGMRILAFVLFLYSFDLLKSVQDPAIALLLSAIFNLVLSYLLLKKEIGISVISALQANWRAIMASMLMAIALSSLKLYLPLNIDLFSFLFLIFSGALTYCTIIVFLWLLSGRPDTIEKQILYRLIKMKRTINEKV